MLLARANIRRKFNLTLAGLAVNQVLYTLDMKQFGGGAAVQAALSFFGANPAGTLMGKGSSIFTGQLNPGGTDWSPASNEVVYGNAIIGINVVFAEWEDNALGLLVIEADNPDAAAQIITVDMSIAITRLGDFS